MDERALLAGVHTIAVVGFSSDEQKPAHYVPAYLHEAGFRILPVNPKVAEAWGERGYASLAEIPEPVDLVLVFRRSEYCPGVVQDALAMAHLPRIIWLQSGIVSPEAEALARDAGIAFVQDRCLMVVHRHMTAS
jgi:predicted CoA-binding protein